MRDRRGHGLTPVLGAMNDPDRIPTRRLPMTDTTTVPRRHDAAAAATTGLYATTDTRETAGGPIQPGRAGVDVADPGGDGRRSDHVFRSDVGLRRQQGRTPRDQHSRRGVRPRRHVTCVLYSDATTATRGSRPPRKNNSTCRGPSATTFPHSFRRRAPMSPPTHKCSTYSSPTSYAATENRSHAG